MVRLRSVRTTVAESDISPSKYPHPRTSVSDYKNGNVITFSLFTTARS